MATHFQSCNANSMDRQLGQDSAAAATVARLKPATNMIYLFMTLRIKRMRTPPMDYPL